MASHSLTESEAVVRINEVDKRRRQFVDRHFDATDPTQYDLVINTGRSSVVVVVSAIAYFVRKKEGLG